MGAARVSVLGAQVVVCALLAGCLDRQLAPLGPCTISGLVRKVRVTRVEKVDLLFVIDDSGSMHEEQGSLADQLPRLVEALASGDLDADSVQDFPPVKSLQVGVISTDMGTGGFLQDSCDEPNFGDDGILRTEGRTDIPGCQAAYPPFLEYAPGAPRSPADLAHDVTCVARMGTGGCGFEQQLEATLKSLTPSTSPIRFFRDTVGHADRENAGFVRDDSLLVVLMLTDEEDCSAGDPQLYDDGEGSPYPGNRNIRCFLHPRAVHPVSRYVDGLLATRTNPDLLIFAAITGIPIGAGNAAGDNFQEILDHELMQERLDPSRPAHDPRLVPSCNVPGRGLAYPPRRIVSLARDLSARGATGRVFSICQNDYRPALDQVAQRIADVLKQTCLPRSLVRSADGLVTCDVVQTLAGGEPTKVPQLAVHDGVVAEGEGWYYDDFGSDLAETCPDTPQRIRFTDGARPPSGAQIRLECLNPIGAGADTIGINTPCASDPAICARGEMDRLSCDAQTNTCQLPCTSDSECPSAHSCDTSLASPICVNPTCG